jgi:HPt (histidine-containing phosphotransfer) domain-containing protein
MQVVNSETNNAIKEWSLPSSLSELQQVDEVDVIKELLSLFRTDTIVRLQSLSDALSHQDYARVKKEAHGIKGSSGQLGAASMAVLCQRIESLATENMAADLTILTATLNSEFERTWQGMAVYLDV